MLTLIAFVLVVGTLVVVHELGHYLAARLIGVRVETFAIGFPPQVWRRRFGDTEFTIGLLPLGGYVTMAGGALEEGTGDPAELRSRTRGERLAILLAGPAMNLGLAVLILAGLFYFGIERRIGLSDPPVVSYVAADSPAGTAGILAGDRIAAIDGEPMPDWRTVVESIAVRPDREAVIAVRRDGEARDFPVRVASRGRDAIGDAGIWPPAPPVIGVVDSGTPAEAAELRPGDRIVAVDGEPVGSTQEVAALVRSGGIREIRLGLEREGQRLAVPITPEWFDDPETADRWPRIGVRFAAPYRRVEADSVGDALREAVSETTRWGALTVRQLGRLFGGGASVRQFSGPIGIAQASGEALRRGPADILLLMAILSLSLGVLNLLPIPVLDGGQIAVLLVESAARRDLSLRVRKALLVAGAIFMLILFALVIFLDLSKL